MTWHPTPIEALAPPLVREDRQPLAFPVFLLQPREQLLAFTVVAEERHRGLREAHVRWTLPIFAPLVPSVFPADSFRHLIKRA